MELSDIVARLRLPLVPKSNGCINEPIWSSSSSLISPSITPSTSSSFESTNGETDEKHNMFTYGIERKEAALKIEILIADYFPQLFGEQTETVNKHSLSATFSSNATQNKQPQLNSNQRKGKQSFVLNQASIYAEQIGSIFSKFYLSLFCGCGLFQCLSMFILCLLLLLILSVYNIDEIRLVMNEFKQHKELNVEQIKYELVYAQSKNEIEFNLNVDINKIKEQNEYKLKSQLIESRKQLTQIFIERNTRTETKRKWSFFGTEVEINSRTHFSEEDIALFQENVLEYAFATDVKKMIDGGKHAAISDGKHTNDDGNNVKDGNSERNINGCKDNQKTDCDSV